MLYHGEKYAADFIEGDRHSVIVSFNCALPDGEVSCPPGKRVNFGRTRFERYRFPCVFIGNKHDDWFQDQEIYTCLDRVKEVVKGYSKVITYGGSMGGYAALSFAKYIGATHALTFNAQTVLYQRPPFRKYYQGDVIATPESLLGSGIKVTACRGIGEDDITQMEYLDRLIKTDKRVFNIKQHAMMGELQSIGFLSHINMSVFKT